MATRARARPSCPTVRANSCLVDAARAGRKLEVRAAGTGYVIAVAGESGVLVRRKSRDDAAAAVARAQEVAGARPLDETKRQTKVNVPQRPHGIPAHYALVDAGELIASHVPTSFVPDPRYPEAVQERQYHADKMEQRKVVMGAQDLNPAFLLTDTPTAVDGPPLVTEDQVVLGGNGRSMMVKRAYQLRLPSASRYKLELTERAPDFGFAPADVEALEEPVLVRVIDGATREMPRKELSDYVRWFNEGLTQAIDAKAKAVAESRQLGPVELGELGELLASTEGSLRDVMRDKPEDILRILEAAGILTAVNRSSWTVAGELTSEAKDRLETLFLGRVLGSADRIRATAPSLLQKVERAVPALVRVAGVNPALDLIPRVQAAVDLLDDARARGISLDDLVHQGALWESAAVDPLSLVLARMLEREKPRAIGERFATWARTAAQDPNQPSMFWAQPTAAEAFEVLTGERAREQNPDWQKVRERAKRATREENPRTSHRQHLEEAAGHLARLESAKLAQKKTEGKFCEACRTRCAPEIARISNPLQVSVVRKGARWAPALVQATRAGIIASTLSEGEPTRTSLEAALAEAKRLATKLGVPLLEGTYEMAEDAGSRVSNPRYVQLIETRATTTEGVARELLPLLDRTGTQLFDVVLPAGVLRLTFSRGELYDVLLNGKPSGRLRKELRADLQTMAATMPGAFDALVRTLKERGVRDPEGLAATITRRKYAEAEEAAEY